MSFADIDVELFEWSFDELYEGSRIKASKINKVRERIEKRHDEWIKEQCKKTQVLS